MSSDPNKKSGRTFQCRDVLWETFEQMARELECSVDYLINESMKQYARQRSYGARTPFPGQGQGAGQGQPGQARDQGNNTGAPPRVQEAQSPPSSDPQPQGRGGYGPPPPAAVRPPPRGGGLPPPPARVAPPPMRASNLPAPPPAGLTGGMGGMSAPRGMSSLPTPPPRGAGLQMPQAPSRSAPPPAPPPAPRSVPPPIPRGMPAATNGFPAPASNATTLSVIYQGEKAAVTKDRFIIGRGKQSSDLTLKDPNVSRQHAMIEFQNGVYFMVDMGSTNGVEYNGQRIARKQIAEGDTFRICDHDLFFTYR